MSAVLGTSIAWTFHLWRKSELMLKPSGEWALPGSLCYQDSLVSSWGLAYTRTSQSQSVSMSVSPSLKTHFHNTCRCPQAEHLYFLTVFKWYKEKEGAQTWQHTSPTMTVFSLRKQQERKQIKHYFPWWGEGIISCSWFSAVMWRQWLSFILLTALSLKHRSCQHTSPGKVQLPGSSLPHH